MVKISGSLMNSIVGSLEEQNQLKTFRLSTFYIYEV